MELTPRAVNQAELLKGAALDSLPCNLCGRADFSMLADRDGLGLAVRTVMCRSCGLTFVNPRPTKDWYDGYYRTMAGFRGSYKHGRESGKQVIGVEFEGERRHGQAMAERMRPYIRSGLTIDVGSSEGGLLFGMREVLDIEPLGIEPTGARAEFARGRGIPTYAALIENIREVAPDLPLASNVICTKSLNHLLDPAYFFRWAFETLDSDGRLILEVKNFRQQVRMSGRLRFGVQIDHPFMFVPETLSAYVRAAGFEILFFDVDEDKSREERYRQKKAGLPMGHMRLAARKTGRLPFSGPIAPRPGVVRRLRRQLSPLALRLYYFMHYAQPLHNLRRRFETVDQGERY